MTQLEIDTGIDSGPPLYSSHAMRMFEVLRHLHALGFPLSKCTGAHYLNRKIGTLKGYVRKIGIVFPDYTPRALKKPAHLKIDP